MVGEANRAGQLGCWHRLAYSDHMELEFIDWLSGRLSQHPSQRRGELRLGIGDDAALLRVEPDEEFVVTTDMLMDGSHFELSRHSLAQIGRKSLAVNLSDMAAMAAEPLAAFVSLALPKSHAAEQARALIDGMLPLAEQFSVALAGGDTNCWSGPLVISVMVVGKCAAGRALRRSGALPGDRMLVTGALGGSLLDHHLSFTPRVREAKLLSARYALHAGCDLSDGLSLDVARVAAASGCGAVLRAARIPISQAARRSAAGDNQRALQHALHDGEDFELLLAVPPDAAERLLSEQPCPVPCTWIGEFVSESGIWLEDPSGHRQPLEPRGYQHGVS
jgi:thiamine-monophosphate kinase